MIIRSIHLKEGIAERVITFSDSANLIHSVKNSCGKTTLLRFILYALGYSVPNTRRIKFGNCETSLIIESDHYGEIKLFRDSDISIETTIKDEKKTFVLPEQQNELHSMLFGTKNMNILNNILGAYYVDQEKGWTLLNRGVVIGSIHFNIEELIRGLSGLDCSELIKKESQVSREIEKYRQMFSVAQYRETLAIDSGDLVTDSYDDETSVVESQLLLRQKSLKRELSRIDKTLSDNRHFKEFVVAMKLFVEAPDGTTFPVTEENIVGLSDAINLLVVKRKLISSEYSKVCAQLCRLNEENDHEEEQLSFFKTANQLEVFDKRIANIPLNQTVINKEISRLEKERKALRDEISRRTRSNTTIVSSISNAIINYSTELGIGTKDSIPAAYLFTSNLKELSGAILHKTAFVFRLAYILAIEEVLKIKIPIILDSPKGKEVDDDNVALMINILKRDFSDHQIIIASIFNYDFEEVNVIEIKERLIGIS